MGEIKVYGAQWCPDCHRSKRLLEDLDVRFEWIDIGESREAAAYVRERNDGAQIIPTIVFPDGSHLAEPSDQELALKLGRSSGRQEASTT